MDITPELYARIHEIALLPADTQPEVVAKMVHETLVLACHEALKDTRQAYGNLFAQVDYLCKAYAVKRADRVAIQTMRRHSNHNIPLSKEDLGYDLRALALLVSATTQTDVPAFLVAVLPNHCKPYAQEEGIDVKYVRCVVRQVEAERIIVAVERGLDAGLLAVDCTDEDLRYVCSLVRTGTQLNLLDGKMEPLQQPVCVGNEVAEQCFRPTLIIVEPDYLLDISAVAACFKEYGHHPLNYLLDRMKPRANSQPILLGNFAGSALDDIINRGDSYQLADTLKANFRERAVEYCTCPGFDPVKFKQDAKVQALNLEGVVKRLFSSRRSASTNAHLLRRNADGTVQRVYSRRTALLEPSFICERLGLQGRVDLMTTDFQLLVEQKSGRNMNIEKGMPNSHGSIQLEPHYVQLLLYYGVLKYNFNIGRDQTDIRLLYSKYEPDKGLMTVAYYRKLFREALRVRNSVVAQEMNIALFGFEHVIDALQPAVVNTRRLATRFYSQYLYPQISAVTEPLHKLSTLEHDYFCQMMTFVYREQLISKIGTQEGVVGCAADVWNMPVSEKKETGNIYLGLTVADKRQSREGNGYDLITLHVPGQGDDFLPNFRRGDMVMLYAYPADAEPHATESIVFRGNLVDIHTDSITVCLNDGQQNPDILAVDNTAETVHSVRSCAVRYALEHAPTDAGSNGAVRGLHELMTAPQHRRDLLLGQRPPQRNPQAHLSRSYHSGYDAVIEAVGQASDYYLLIGPPGTGKTSMALRFMVEEELTHNGATILLMAYTNRAVDEICGMLDEAQIDYLRLGNEYSCDARFRSRLLEKAVEDCPRLTDIKQRIASARVITGTTSMLVARPFIFNIKHFSLAIVDEASQILEPNLIGLLAAHRLGADGQEHCCIDRFVLVGDYKQLPAVVQQSSKASAVASEALKSIGISNCRDSLFERLIRWERRCGRQDFVGVLHRQGRMHPDIAAFPNEMFYTAEHIEPVPLPHQQETALDYLPTDNPDALDRLLRTRRTIFLPSADCRQPDLSDKVNTAEAALVADLLQRIRRMTGSRFDTNKTVGVIVPYRNQIAMIRKKIEALGMPELEQVSIDTVERYQGSQRDVIIYSFTIQRGYQLGFLTSNCFTEQGHTIDRKLNVALTRARRQMIAIGNPKVLRRNPVFEQLISSFEAEKQQ